MKRGISCPRAADSVVTMDHRTPTAATEPAAIATACQQDRARVAAALEEAARVGMPADVTALLLAEAIHGPDLVERIRGVFARARAIRAERLLQGDL